MPVKQNYVSDDSVSHQDMNNISIQHNAYEGAIPMFVKTQAEYDSLSTEEKNSTSKGYLIIN